MNKSISLLLTLCILALGVILGVLNPHMVKFDAFFAVVEWPLSLLLAIAFVFGALLTLIVFMSKMVLLNWQLKKHIKENARQSEKLVQLKKEITQLKSIPKSTTPTPLTKA